MMVPAHVRVGSPFRTTATAILLACLVAGCATSGPSSSVNASCQGQVTPAGDIDWCTRWLSVGYELHITRAEEWFSSAAKPISRSEWSQLADGNDRLIPTSDPTTFTLDNENGPALYWVDDQINVKGVERPEQITELALLARQLDATLQGDDGEMYDPSLPIPS